MTLYPDLHDAARAAQRLRDRHLRHAGLALSSGWRWITTQQLAEAEAADLEQAQLLSESHSTDAPPDREETDTR